MTGADPSAPRRLVVLRHGETTYNASGVWQGQLDVPLSDRGEAQAALAGPAVAALGPVRVVTSDLQRARRTAEAVAVAAGVPLVEDPRFREIGAGAWEGLTSAEVRERFADDWAAVLRGEDIRRGGDGESMADVLERTSTALTEHLASLGPGECLVVSTHGAAGRAAAGWLLGLDQEVVWRVLGGLGNCCWAELVEGRRGWFVRTWNVSAGAVAETADSPP